MIGEFCFKTIPRFSSFKDCCNETSILHIMDSESTEYSVLQCSNCPEDTKYFCKSCPCNLCPQCKDIHVHALKTIDHDVVIYLEKLNYISEKESCARHARNVYKIFCNFCQVPVCNSCSKEKSHGFSSFLFGKGQHVTLSIQEAYRAIKQQHHGKFHTIRSEALSYRNIILKDIKSDFKACHTKLSVFQIEMVEKAERIKRRLDNLLSDLDVTHRCLKQKKKIIGHLASLQIYEDRYEQSALSPLQFLLAKKDQNLYIHLTLHIDRFLMTRSLNKDEVMKSLCEIEILGSEKRSVGNNRLFKQMSDIDLHNDLGVRDCEGCYHVSCVTPELFWVSDAKDNLVLKNIKGKKLHHRKDVYAGIFSGLGFHTVNSSSELLYINAKYNINKLSTDMKTTTIFIKRTASWVPWCVYCSKLTDDVLVGMNTKKPLVCKVTRYNQAGEQTQTIRYDNIGVQLGAKPHFISENNNGDILVSFNDNISGVVVTEGSGRYRFTYTGHPPGSEVRARGICTDVLSNILVCNNKTFRIEILDKNGQFLSNLSIRPKSFLPISLSYDLNTHRLWVGSQINNRVDVYRYITRQDALTGIALNDH